MDILDKTLFHLGDYPITLFSIIVFIIIFLITLIIAFIAKKALSKKIFPKYGIEKGVARAYANIINYTIIVVGVLIALNFAGVQLSVLFAGSAALLVGIGFGVQNIVNNFISGVIILFEKSIKEGDFIEVNGVLGTVIGIGARSTKVRTGSGVVIIVPNSTFLQENVINRSYDPITMVDIPVVIAYNSDLEKVKSVLIRIANSNELILKEPLPSVSFSEFMDNGIKVKLLVWIKEQPEIFAVRSFANYHILKEFEKEGIVIPYPKMDVKLEKER